MEEPKRGKEVQILGERYTIRGDAPDEYIEKLASYLDMKMRELREKASHIPYEKLSIMAALNIIDELFTLREPQEEIVKKIDKIIALLNKSIST